MLTGTAQNLSFTFGTEDFDNQLGAAVLQTIGDFINRGMELMFLGSISKADFGLIQPILASNGYSHLHKERPSQVVDVIAFQNQTFDILQEMSSVIKDDIVEEAKKSGIPYDISTSVDGDATCLVISIQEKRSGNILVTAFANITATPLTRPELRLVQIVSALKRAAHMVPSPDAALMCCVCGIGEPNYSFRRAVRCGKLTTADQDTFAHIKTVPLQYGGVMSLPMVAFNLYMHDIKDLHHLDLNMNTAVIYTGELLSVRPVDDGDLTDSMTIKMH